MTDAAPQSATPTGSPRRTAVLLVAWLAAAAAAGTPDDAAGTANAKARATPIPVVNSGPECFAGHAPPPPPSKGRD
jgi:hypothetical protein